MKPFAFKPLFAAGIVLASVAAAPRLHATAVSVFIEGGSASSSILYDRATNLFAGGSFAFHGSTSANVVEFVGTSTNAALSGYNSITLDINLANGAIAGLDALVNQSPGSGDTNYAGSKLIPTFVDSATSPEAVGISSTANNLETDYATYVVPLVYVKNGNSIDTAAITNLTQRQAVALETSLNKSTFFGGSSTNWVYFVGRNNEAAVRTELDLNIYNSGNILTFTNNAANAPVQDTNPNGDPGLSSASKEVTVVTALTNSIGEVAVQNVKSPLIALSYEGVPYSTTNVVNGSYPLWGYEHYYFIQSGFTGAPTPDQQAVLDTFYASVTNAAFQSLNNPVFTNSFVSIPSLKVTRQYDGGPIIPLPNY